MTTVLVILGMVAGLALLGVHIVFAFILASVIGLTTTFGGFEPAMKLLQQTAMSQMTSYTLIVVPLFGVMGAVIGASGAASDLFQVVRKYLGGLPGNLAVATVGGNAVFAAVTGVGAASVVTFSRIAFPVMKKAGYTDRFSAGVITGSSVLGLLIPPSVFMIIFAVLTEQSVGALFAAGVLPGLFMAALFALFCVTYAIRFPQRVPASTLDSQHLTASARNGAILVCGLIVVTLGGIWGGWFTPTEGAAIGMFGSIGIALFKRVPAREILKAAFQAGEMITPILLLILGAAMYTQLLALEGIPSIIATAFTDAQFTPFKTMLIFIGVWLVLGCLIDSISIMLLTVPIFWPVAQSVGIDPLVFALIGILAIEAGVLTPPFGIAVFIAKAAIPSADIRIGDIFRGVAPYCLMILITAATIWFFPQIVTWLPSKL